MGINELDRERYGTMYNSIVYIGPDGVVLGTHRKISNTNRERLFNQSHPDRTMQALNASKRERERFA